LEGLVLKAAADFEEFYAVRSRSPADAADTLILSCDGKGIVMRPEAARPAPPPGSSQLTETSLYQLFTGQSQFCGYIRVT
jgi:hypothetical protein